MRIGLLVCCAITSLLVLVQAKACDVMDDAGQLVHLDKPAVRIISLAPDITENLFAIGAGSQMVGVMSGSNYPVDALKIPTIGSYTGLDLERILSLKPDLIVTWGATFSGQLAVLKKLGVPVYTTQPSHLEDIPRTIKNFGCLTGHEKTANQLANDFLKQLQTLSHQYHLQKPVSVFYQIGSYSLITINKDSWINQAIALCGGVNVFASAKLAAPEVSWEAVVAANPDVIISSASNEHWKKNFTQWKTLAAVKNQFLFTIEPDLIERASPRLLEGIQHLCRSIHSGKTLMG